MPNESDSQQPNQAEFWPHGWWRLLETRIGVVPLPVFVAVIGLTAAFAATGEVPAGILMNIAIVTVGGFGCAEIGNRLPLVNRIGAAAIFATFVPSYLVYARLLPVPVIASVTDFTRSSNVLYLYISAIVVGSIFGMDRRLLVAGFLKIFVPLSFGSVVAAAVGIGVGALFGLEPRHTFFFIVAPIMAGGVGEGAIPLSIGYAQYLHAPAGTLLAQILPAVMLGSLFAILIAGMLNLVGKLRPGLTGDGRLTVGESTAPVLTDQGVALHPGAATVAAAVVTTTTLYLVGALTHRLWNWPGPVVMLLLAVLLKLGRVVSPQLEQGAFAVFQFFRTAVTYPLLFAIGVALTPWKDLVGALTVPNIVTIASTVVALIATGFVTARLIGMYPVDTAIVTACHSGQGGTGDVAILTAANRMQLMPFAQIATRIGGACTVIATLATLARLA